MYLLLNEGRTTRGSSKANLNIVMWMVHFRITYCINYISFVLRVPIYLIMNGQSEIYH